MMKNITKMGADSLAENTPRIYLPALSAQAEKLLISKRLHWAFVVRGMHNVKELNATSIRVCSSNLI